MKITVETEVLRKALDLCGVVASSKAETDDAARVKTYLIFSVRNGEFQIAAFDRHHLVHVPIEGEVESPPVTNVSFAVELFRLKQGVDNSKGEDVVIRYTEEDAEEGHVYFQYTARRAPMPYPTYDPTTYANYHSILDRAKADHEWEVPSLVEALQFMKQFVSDDRKAQEHRRVLEVFEDIEMRWVMQGNVGILGFAYPANAGGDLKLTSEHMKRLASFLSKSKSEGMVSVKDAKNYYVFQTEEGASFAFRTTGLKGKRFRSDPLRERNPEAVRFKVKREALQSTLGIVLSGMSTRSGRIRLKVLSSDPETLIVTAQTVDGRKTFDHEVDIESLDDVGVEAFEHFTECRSLFNVLPSMASDLTVAVEVGNYMRIIDKKGDTVRVVVAPGMGEQKF